MTENHSWTYRVEQFLPSDAIAAHALPKQFTDWLNGQAAGGWEVFSVHALNEKAREVVLRKARTPPG